MIHLGDVCKINGTKVPPVECLTFGAPCQDLSQAGKRRGLRHSELGDEETTRSGLFFEAVRLIKEMRSNGHRCAGRTDELERFPRYCIYENVPGALSSNKGEDFRLVLEYLARIGEPDASIPMPEKGKWANAGCIAGDGWSLAWRVGNALNFGVPQRRRRVCVLLSLDERERSTDSASQDEALSDIRAPRAAEILFERQGRGGNDIPRFAPWQSLARYSADGAGERDYTLQIRCGKPGGGKGALVQTDISATLSTSAQQVLFQAEREAIGADLYAGDVTGDVTMTLTAARNDDHHIPCVIEPSGGFLYLNSAKTRSIGFEWDQSPTLAAEGQVPAIVYKQVEEPIGVDGYHQSLTGDATFAMRAAPGDGIPMAVVPEQKRYHVRRPTPLECERLQAFPDNWTVLPEKTEMTDEEYAEWQSIRRTWTEMNGKTYKPAKDKAAMLTWYNKMIKADSARYKALGNSIAVCQWYRLFWKMRPYLSERPTLGSLFDGIGGFPLAWESLYGKGSALWASEVEPFPIAVTKYHFSEEDNNG